MHWAVFLCGGCFGLQYVFPSRLFSIRGRLLSLALVFTLWYALFFFHARNAVVFREVALACLFLHYCFGVFYVCCFVNESLALNSSDIKDKKIEILRSWQRDSMWKRQSILQV